MRNDVSLRVSFTTFSGEKLVSRSLLTEKVLDTFDVTMKRLKNQTLELTLRLIFIQNTEQVTDL